MTKRSNNNPARLDYWKLIDRVACSGKVSPTAVMVLMRLLQHRNTETGQCNPSINILAKRLFPTLTPRSGYDKVQLALTELKKAGIILAIKRFNSSNVYKVKFAWGFDEVDTSLSDAVKTTELNDKGNSKDQNDKDRNETHSPSSLDASNDVISPDNEVALSLDKSRDDISSLKKPIGTKTHFADWQIRPEIRTLTDYELGVRTSYDVSPAENIAERRAKMRQLMDHRQINHG